MEFFQFHPTGIMGLGILISEAVRGEGGILRNRDGERFMERYSPTLLDLAPRDIVARSILTEIRAGQGIRGDRKIDDYVHLDATHLGKETLKAANCPTSAASARPTWASIRPTRPYRCCPRPTTPWAASPRMSTGA
jgi:succinate dehydrogenase/fumarate reductase flavoprotein subunit